MSFFLSKRIIKVNNEDEEKKSYIIKLPQLVNKKDMGS